MCGRYYIADEDSEEELRQLIDQMQRRQKESSPAVKCSGEVFPTDVVPVLANNRGLRLTAFAMKWGYALPNGRLLINARSESAAEKPLFREGMARRRCLVPASHYFEWEKRGSRRVKYAIRPEACRTIYMAGIYRLEGDLPAFAILTRAVAPSIAFIHDRMPVLLPAEARADWLNPRYPADDVLRAAALNVAGRAV